MAAPGAIGGILPAMREPRLSVLFALCVAGCGTPRPVVGVPAPGPAGEVVGHSVEGRPIVARRVGHGTRCVLFVGSIHGDEREGRVATAALPGLVRADPELAGRVRLVVVEDLNPDGSAARRRYNARGVDLNRNFPAANFRPGRRNGARPESEPEARALADLVRRERPDLVIVCHSARDGSYVNFDGPGRVLAERFARRAGWRVVPSEELHATPGSLGSWIGIDQGVPILTLEFRRGMDPRDAWREIRPAILHLLRNPS